MYAKKRRKGAPLDRCVGFIDGKAVQIARPVEGQRTCYSGHKRYHFLKFQNITTPDGLIFHLFGPLEGRRHDKRLYDESGVDEKLESSLLIDSTQYYIYDNPAYQIRPWLIVGFRGINRNPEQNEFNRAMSSFGRRSNGILKKSSRHYLDWDIQGL